MNYRTIILPISILCVAATVSLADTFTVANTDDMGTGSLRQAITDANNHAGLDDIVFNIPGAGQHTITPVTDLPSITDSVAIDGANAGIASNRVELTSPAGGLSSGLAVSTTNNVSISSLVINGFTSRQILIINASDIQISAVYLGVNATGTAIVAGSNTGIESINSSNVLIGGGGPSTLNVISSVNNTPIVVGGGNATINNNYIGLDVSGTTKLGNPNIGIWISNASAVVGNATNSPANVIVAGTGIEVGGNPALGHSTATIQGNFIGTDATGTKALNLSNSAGINVSHATGVVINTGNVVSGNGDGITISSSGISGASSDSTTVQGNFIGTGPDGVTQVGNTRRGVSVFLSHDNRIGGINGGEGNTIAFNGELGVAIGLDVRNSVQGNSIFSNGGLGIDLDQSGVTFNDPGDVDTGGNNLQNSPVFSSVTISKSGNAGISGTLNSTPNTTFRVEVFASDESDSAGYGEGKNFIGFTNVTTNASGDATWGGTFPTTDTARVFTATATDPDGNTSEFSAAFRARLLNISTRMKVLTGEKVLIGGFIINGAGPKRVIVRGIGPSLGALGVPDALADPTLELHGAIGINNNNWRDSQEAEIIATGLPPNNDLESAIVASLDPGNYTAILAGINETTGVGLVEVYDLDQSAGSKLANISTRGFVDIDDNVMIGGLISGPAIGATEVLLRAIGPSLISVGIQDALQDPALELHDGSGAIVAMNDNWMDTQQAEIEATGLAPTDNNESAILQTLAPGNYTAIVRGNNNTTGVGLVEAYNLR
jgi:hypothetical protein